MNASELLVACLEEEGIEYIFGVPGEENADFMMALEQSDKIQFILTRHEQGAAFMAEAYGRLTGTPAACLGTLGPGATNLITGVANANMDSVPMLVLTGQGASTRLHKESHQIMDVVKMFEPVTKWAVSILHPNNIPEIVRKSVRLARSEKPGACHIELPEDVAKMLVDAQPMTPRRFLSPVVDQSQISLAFEALKAAKRPILLVGNGCVRRHASKHLRKFCEKTGIGAINTFMAKGCVDKDADYCLFTVGLQAKDVISCALDASDLVITLGYDMVEYHPKLWNARSNKKIIHADFEPAEIDEHYHPEIELIGDLSHTLEALNQCIQDNGGAVTRNLSQQLNIRKAMLHDLHAHDEDETEGFIRPQKAIADARHVLSANDILLSDVGAHKMWIARHYQCHEPNTCLIPNGFCSMGFALPGGIGASLLYPDKRILSICGDAGFLMNVQEMETAKRLNSNLTVMIWEDHAYGLIAWKQENQFGKHTDLSFNNPDWMLLAKSFDWNGFNVEKSVDLTPTLEQAFQADGPSLIVIPIDYRENMILTQRLGDIACPI